MYFFSRFTFSIPIGWKGEIQTSFVRNSAPPFLPAKALYSFKTHDSFLADWIRHLKDAPQRIVTRRSPEYNSERWVPLVFLSIVSVDGTSLSILIFLTVSSEFYRKRQLLLSISKRLLWSIWYCFAIRLSFRLLERQIPFPEASLFCSFARQAGQCIGDRTAKGVFTSNS